MAKLKPGQREWFDRFRRQTLYEAMHVDEVRAGTMTFREAAERNIEWVREHINCVTKILERSIWDLSGEKPE